MTTSQRWPVAEPISTARLQLEPLRADHADELVTALDDPTLHRFIGGAPAGLAELRERYARQALGRSPDGSQGWLNWVARRDDRAVGTVQATVVDEDAGRVAELAWVVVSGQQGEGLAVEAALGVAEWLRGQGVRRFRAHIHPRHAASHGVARRLGLAPTPHVVAGEVRWTSYGA